MARAVHTALSIPPVSTRGPGKRFCEGHEQVVEYPSYDNVVVDTTYACYHKHAPSHSLKEKILKLKGLSGGFYFHSKRIE